MGKLQKKLAAKILKKGKSKIWLDPSKIEDIEKAITKADIRRLIKKGFIKVRKNKVPKLKEKGGKRVKKGGKYSVVTAKRKWINTIRPIRRMLKELKETGQIDNRTYRKLYLLAKGGTFRSRSHLKIYLEQHGLLKKK